MTEIFSPKGILLDIDGTLTNSRREIAPETIRVLKLLETRGIPYGVSTGRHFAAIKSYILPLFPSNNLHITSGGGQIITTEGEVLWQHLIEPKVVEALVTEVEKMGGALAIGSESSIYCSDSIYENLLSHPWHIGVRRLSEQNPSALKVPLVSVLQLNDGLKAYIRSLGGLTATLITSNPDRPYFDITAKGVNKATTALLWSEKQSVAMKDLVAVGDSENDLDLLLAVGYGVAMGQAPEKIKRVAKEVIGTTDDNGLAIFLTRLLDSIPSS